MSAQTAVFWIAMAFTSFIPGTQSKPDFSGRWTLNIAESEFPGARPSSATLSVVRTVEQRRNELRLKIERVNNGQKIGFNFVTIPIGGQPHVSDEAGIITAQWKDDTLHFNYLYNPGTERQSERTEDWALSPDGQKLLDQEWGKRTDGQELRSKLVFDSSPEHPRPNRRFKPLAAASTVAAESAADSEGTELTPSARPARPVRWRPKPLNRH
jgi:hypothetical protein